MSRITSEVTIHYCDGCGRETVQFKGDNLPAGFYLEISDVTRADVKRGELYVCGEKCILRAFRRRLEIWEPEKWKVKSDA